MNPTVALPMARSMVSGSLFLPLLLVRSAFAWEGASPLGRWRCVSNYIPSPQVNYDLSTWQRDFKDIKQAGFNAVWMVNVWAEFQPSLEPRVEEAGRMRWLREVCRMAQGNGLTLILALGYVGEGWAPKGLDAQVWPLLPEQLQHYIAFLRRMAMETKDFPNVVYLLASEEILPATLLYRPDHRRECVEAFKEWVKATKPDIGYWNQRWGTSFTWETLKPLSTQERSRWEMWMDHHLWFASILRRILPPMVAALRAERPNAVVGFHDFLLDPLLPPPSPEQASLPSPNPFDFYSLGYYFDPKKSLEENLSAMQRKIDLARRLYPRLPLWMGELGADVGAVGEEKQKDWLSLAISSLKRQGMGYSIWNWRHYLERGTSSFSLLREDGSPRPALESVQRLNREDP